MFAIKSPQTYHDQPGLLSRAGELLAVHSSNIAIITSPKAWEAVNPQLENSLNAAGVRWQVNFLITECTDAAIETHLVSVSEQNATLILGIGGGPVLDCAKAIANLLTDVLLRQYDAPLVLPELNGDRAEILSTITREVKFSAEDAACLPFSMAAEHIERALRATETHQYS